MDERIYTTSDVTEPETQCKVPDCDLCVLALGYCSMHYHRKRNGRDLTAPARKQKEPAKTCSVPGCTGTYKAKGLCRQHYARQQKGIPFDRPWGRHYGQKNERRKPVIEQAPEILRGWGW